MSYLDTYRNRLQSALGNSTRPSVFSSKNTIKNNFSNSLFSEKVLINNVEHEVIPTQLEKSTDKKILMMPDVKINIGEVVRMNNLNYLVTDFLGEGINEIYPTATMKLCNSTFPIQTDETSILLTDDEGNPILDIYNDEQFIAIGGEPIDVPCIVETSYSTKDDNVQLPLPDNSIKVTIQYNNSSCIALNYEFEMYDETYKISHIDKSKVINGVGLLIITAKVVASE